jgi:CubicO group peptidase (beta-lactamase class C family)
MIMRVSLLAKGPSISLKLAVSWAFLLAATSSAIGDPMEDSLKSAVEAGDLPGLHSALVVFKGERIGEAYFPGEDERWGTPIGRIEHGPQTLHDIRSVTKSVVGLLYGIALKDGLVPELDAPLLAQFPQYADLKDGSDREIITIRDALTMQMGTKWDESLPYTGLQNSEVAMEYADDRYRYALDRPMVETPGTVWSYNGGAVALLGKLIADGAGQPLEVFAKDVLFDPLGIETFEWVQGADGIASAASGLRLTARDLGRIGQMVAQDGIYNGHQIVPFDWLNASFTPTVQIDEGFHYGFLWYLSEAPGGDRVAIGIGNGGQRLTIQPKADFVVTTFTGSYNDPDSWRLPIDVLLKHAIPAVNAHANP